MKTLSPIRVMVVDDFEPIRQSIGFGLELFEDLQWVGEAGDGEEAVQLCSELKPDVILMDLEMPKMDGIKATQLLKEHCAQAKIIVMINFKDEALINAAIEAGASGYILRIVSLDRLADEIRAVFRLTPPDLHQSAHTPNL